MDNSVLLFTVTHVHRCPIYNCKVLWNIQPYISFESLPLQLNFQCVNFNICFSADLFSMPCTAPTKVLIYLCTATQLTKNSSVVKWGESYWRACEGIAWVRVASSIQSDTQLFSRLHYNSKVHSFTPWQWAKVVLIGVPECVSIEFALHCISWQCTAEIAM